MSCYEWIGCRCCTICVPSGGQVVGVFSFHGWVSCSRWAMSVLWWVGVLDCGWMGVLY